MQALLLSLFLVTAAPAAAARPTPAADPGVISKWNEIAATTIQPNPAAFLNYSLVHLAVYNAVVGITHEYDLYEWTRRGPRIASPEAAAAVAAHRILVTYFATTPELVASLDAELAASLAQVPAGISKHLGMRYGRQAADHIIALRANDGRGASVTVPTADEPGEWRPTPPAEAMMAVPWLGQVTPLALHSLRQFDPGPPPRLGTPEYRAQLEEVRVMGAIDSTERDAEETALAQYFAGVPFRPMEAALRGVALDNGLDISDSARLFAATNVSMADALGTAWNAKLRYFFWRPITAIREIPLSDGDLMTVADPDWAPLIINPPYPEWPSGLCSVIGALTSSLEHVVGEVDITLGTTTAGFLPREFESKTSLDSQAVDARVWSGIHFRSSDEVAIVIGNRTADWTMDHYFGSSR